MSPREISYIICSIVTMIAIDFFFSTPGHPVGETLVLTFTNGVAILLTMHAIIFSFAVPIARSLVPYNTEALFSVKLAFVEEAKQVYSKYPIELNTLLGVIIVAAIIITLSELVVYLWERRVNLVENDNKN